MCFIDESIIFCLQIKYTTNFIILVYFILILLSFEVHFALPLVEVSIRDIKSRIDHIACSEMEESEQEFWTKQLRSKLEPQKAIVMSGNDLRKKLKVLRNLVMCGMLFINVVWIIVLLTLKIRINDTYKIPDQTLTLLFLFIYNVHGHLAGPILIHRCTTLTHYVARSI